jgi:triacylglycerol lipase
MRKEFVLLLAAVLLAQVLALPVSGAEVIVLVHGIAGWGTDELLGVLKYWSPQDVVRQYESQGFTVFQASVGPVSSNWDRACELYAQIKGTRVDYGAAHSSLHGHARFGNDYTGKGFVPGWSTSNKIHLLGHSMGGSTARLLEALLQEGAPEEVQATGAGTSALFSKQGNLIKTLSTVSTPHDGTPLVDMLGSGVVDLLKNLVLAFAGASSVTALQGVYNFDLAHFGLEQRAGETMGAYFARVFASPIFAPGYKDLAPFDLSPAGAKALQRRGKQTYPGTRYFGLASEQTSALWGCSFSGCGWYYVASLSMTLPLAPFANMLGALSQPAELRQSDGLVPLESAKCPKTAYGSSAKCQQYSGSWPEGAWVWQAISYDHIQVIGFSLFNLVNPAGAYLAHAKRTKAVSQAGYTTQSIDADAAQQDSVVVTELPQAAMQLPVPLLVALACMSLVGVVVIAAVIVSAVRRNAAGVPHSSVVAPPADLESSNPKLRL